MLLLEHFNFSTRVNNKNHLQNIIDGFCEDHADAETHNESKTPIGFPLFYKDFYIITRPGEDTGKAASLLSQMIKHNNKERETLIEPKLILYSPQDKYLCLIYAETKIRFTPKGEDNVKTDHDQTAEK